MDERTTSVHGPAPHARGSLVHPIHQTSTFALESAADVDDVYEGRRAGDVYTRYSNPTLASVEARLAQLEATESALVTASGMGATSAIVMGLVGAGGRIVATEDLYGGTLRLFATLRDRFGVRVDFVSTTEPAVLEAALRTPADLVFLETPTNPTLRLVDLAESARIAKSAGVTSVVDSTFATPINTKPHTLGIDLVMHSATKYLAGHSDITAGAVCGSKELLDRIRSWHVLQGGVLDPHAAFLLERGLRTLPMRVKAANENGAHIAAWLATQPTVKAVHHPSLASHPQHALAKRQMRGMGGVLSFDLDSLDAAKRFLDALQLVRNAASLGGVESLASLPVQQSHRNQSATVLAKSGITQGTVRLALGIEAPDDIQADLQQALAAARKNP